MSILDFDHPLGGGSLGGRKRFGLFGGFPDQEDHYNLRQPMPPAQQSMPEKKGGFFSEGGAGRGIAGAIGDYLLQASGMRPIYAPQRQYQQRLAHQQKLLEQQRQAAREDKMWEWQNKPADAPKPYRWKNNNGDLMDIGPDGLPRVVYDDPTDKINWIQVKDPATGAIQIVPMGPSGMMGGEAAPDTLPPGFFD